MTGSRSRIRPIVDAAERHDRRTHALGTKAGKRLRMPALEERGDGEHLGA